MPCRRACRTTNWNIHSHLNVVFFMVGYWLARTLPNRPRTGQALNRSSRLRHKMDQSWASKITTKNAMKLFKKSIVVIFGIPEAVVTNNGTKFIDKNFWNLMVDLFIKHHFTLVEHPRPTDRQKQQIESLLKNLDAALTKPRATRSKNFPMYCGLTGPLLIQQPGNLLFDLHMELKLS